MSTIRKGWFPVRREEYMKVLRDALSDMDNEISAEIISDYEQHFEQGLKGGKSEEQICEELGSIEELIEDINGLKKNIKPKQQDTNTLDVPARTQEREDQIHGAGKKIIVDTKSADVIIGRSNHQKVDAYYENFGNVKQQMIYQFYFYEESDTIFIGVNQTETKGGFFNRLLVPEMKITILIPDGMESLKIKTPSGDTRLDGISISEVDIETVSGDISIQESIIEKIGIRACSGDINIRNVKSKYINMRSTSGDVETVDVISEQCYIGSSSGDVKYLNITGMKLEVSSASGDISISEGMAENMKIQTSSGDVNMSRLKVVELIGNCSSGDIRGENLTIVNGGIQSASGDLIINHVLGNHLTCGSKSGDIKIQGVLQDIEAKTVSGDLTIVNEGDFNGNLGTTSGDMVVKLKNNGNGYHVDLKSSVGDVYINYQGKRVSTDKKGVYVYGNEGSKIKCVSTTGDIRITD